MGAGARAFLPQAGRVSLPAAEGRPATAYAAAGYRRCGTLAVRLDMLERLADALREARKAAGSAPFAAPPEMAALIGCSREELGRVLQALGYRAIRPKPVSAAPAAAPAETAAPDAAAAPPAPLAAELWRAPRPRRQREGAPSREVSSPFAALADLKQPAQPAPRRRKRRS